MKARELRVVGGVDKVSNFAKLIASDPLVSQAGRLPIRRATCPCPPWPSNATREQLNC
jgi:hypothetical protein